MSQLIVLKALPMKTQSKKQEPADYIEPLPFMCTLTISDTLIIQGTRDPAAAVCCAATALVKHAEGNTVVPHMPLQHSDQALFCGVVPPEAWGLVQPEPLAQLLQLIKVNRSIWACLLGEAAIPLQ